MSHVICIISTVLHSSFIEIRVGARHGPKKVTVGCGMLCVSVELLFMCSAIYLCYCTRAAPSNYREVRYISWAIYNETIVSAVFYVCRLVSFINSEHTQYRKLTYQYISMLYYIVDAVGQKWFHFNVYENFGDIH